MLGERVEVDLLGRRLFAIWGRLGDVSPQERARRLSDRLGEPAHSRDLDPNDLRVVQGSTLATLQLGDVIVMGVSDEDARPGRQPRR